MTLFKRTLKYIATILIINILSTNTHGQNPICPPGMYIADPEAHVWEDGKIYIYGSRDESDAYWCSHKHHVLFSDDLKTWQVVEDAFASKGTNDQVSYCDHLLFAPDCAYKDGTYYLYYCSPDRKMYTEGVATSKYPTGPFTNGKHIKGAQEIDPAVLVDDDGQAYYLWGQGYPKMAKLKPNMMCIDQTTICKPLNQAGNEAFHEGSSIRKIGDWYYLVFADDSRNNRPTCLGYAISKKPMGPYEYKGVIIDNAGSDPSIWNNHGSIEAFNGQWYVFYHRSTHNSQKYRKTCLEPIQINKDGTINEVEMTSQGALSYLPAQSLIQAERACLLYGSVFIDHLINNDYPNEILTHINHNDYAAYKYLHFEKGINRFRIKTFNATGGAVELRIDSEDGKLVGTCQINPQPNNTAYQISECKVSNIKGKHALFLVFKGGSGHMFDVDYFEFLKQPL
ncbi:family 43 glycosylhydrolase [Saccharicrinis fermentans]|uniref:Xylosidase/arabinosidase n=1 Tax=Saccharicrinis fermentans DSM 9555 = JCM 21142 TaxID=869213 RepID=W7YK38_9BACT|nr:family 43 glycosylhydrolase [Saccharicrinis fermentans]GAF02694.1 xylosidase/arabinosidase [Saccharicrinis fermentans DSM 9555 = JCM 21142]